MSSTNRGGQRSPADFYATPAWCVHRLIEALPYYLIAGSRWLEPAAGDGAIIRAVAASPRVGGRLYAPQGRLTWDALELREECRPALEATGARVTIGDALVAPPGGVDPLRRVVWPAADFIITNPPFSLALEFVVKAVVETRTTTAMLLPLNWLGTEDRNEFLRHRTPDVYVLPDRPSFTGCGTDSVTYGWFVWPRGREEGESGELTVLPTTPLVPRSASVAEAQALVASGRARPRR